MKTKTTKPAAKKVTKKAKLTPEQEESIVRHVTRRIQGKNVTSTVRDVYDVEGLGDDDEFMNSAAELIQLTDREKKMKDRIAELRLFCHEKMHSVLAETDERSVEYGTHRLTMQQGEPRKILNMAKLAKLVPAAKLAKCYELGDPPRPTVVVNRLKE